MEQQEQLERSVEERVAARRSTSKDQRGVNYLIEWRNDTMSGDQQRA